ncbi:mRNA cap guanine-N7 methyltransferase 2 [Iris pallida]|uniref:mRNA (guanine-N(7))-methyltransferase n=1 Tax=Iris pallida TaxID=29817 RepID=A0AAX6GHB0_IRIPA|nr:mRNA cap guanine-N7 methyltransferase 2 [Iris pallida]
MMMPAASAAAPPPPVPPLPFPLVRTEPFHRRLYEFAKTALIRIFVSPYATVCDLYSGAGADADKWEDAQIGHYIGIGKQTHNTPPKKTLKSAPCPRVKFSLLSCFVWFFRTDVPSSGIADALEAWESQTKPYTAEFLELDPCTENLEAHLKDKGKPADVVCCLQHLQLCFESEERAGSLLRNVSSLLRPGGYFFGQSTKRMLKLRTIKELA